MNSEQILMIKEKLGSYSPSAGYISTTEIKIDSEVTDVPFVTIESNNIGRTLNKLAGMGVLRYYVRQPEDENDLMLELTPCYITSSGVGYETRHYITLEDTTSQPQSI